MTASPRFRRRATRLLCLLAALGCYTSPRPEEYRPATNPRGVMGTLSFSGNRSVRVELLELQDSAFVVLLDDRVGIAPFRVVLDARFDRIGVVAVARSAPPAELHEQLRLASRFPFGIPPEALAALLAVHDQAAPDELAAERAK